MQQHRIDLQRRGTATAWLTLTCRDDEFARFQGLFRDAIVSLEGTIASSSGVASPVSRVGDFAASMLDAVGKRKDAFALFIDGFESIQDPSILEFLQLLVPLLPPQGKLCIASRKPLPLQLGRLRAEGLMLQIDQTLLRFSQHETQRYLCSQWKLELDTDTIAKLHCDTGGWPAILRLAASEMAATDDPQVFIERFSGAHAAIAEFISEEILRRLPAEIQKFLLECSVLREFDCSVCDAVFARTDSDSILRSLEESQVFLIALDADRGRFRFRPLISAVLRRELSRAQPQRVPLLNLAAAKWYHSQGRIVPAMEHALASGFTDYALFLLQSSAETLLCQGRSRLLTRWFERLPAGALQPFYELRVAQIWALTTLRRGDEALRRLDELSADESRLALTSDLQAEVGVLRSCVLAVIDRAAEGAWLVREDLRKLPSRDSIVHRIMVTTLATWKVASNQFADAVSLAQMFHSRADHGAVSSSYYVAFIEGLIALVQCRIRESIAHFRVALISATPAFKSVIAIHLAEALYEIDGMQEANDLLIAYGPAIRDYGRSDQLIICHVLQARIAQSNGDVDSAFLRLSELEHIARNEHLPRALASSRLERARMALCDGDLAMAEAHLNRSCDPDTWNGLRGMMMPANDVETVDLGRYRLQIRSAPKDDIAATLAAEVKAAQACQRNRRALRLNLLLARVLHSGGQQRLAMRTIEGVLRIAKQEGLIRAFVDEGDPIIELIRAFRLAKQTASELSQDAQLAAFVDKILTRAGVDLDVGERRDAVPELPTLTARELQTLDALAIGLSNIKIAERLFVSETTVRSHLRRISVKLGTSSRTQAVCVARNFGLI